MDEGAWWAAVHGVAKSRTWLSDITFTFHFHALEKEMATHSSVLFWRIPGMGEPGELLSLGSDTTKWLSSSSRASLMAQKVKHLPAMQETQVRSLGWEDPLVKEMATHSSTLAWKITGTEEPGRLQFMGSQRIGHHWATSLTHSLTHSYRRKQWIV